MAAIWLVATLPSAVGIAEARQLTLGFGDPSFNGAGRDDALNLGLQAGAQIVRLGVNWSTVAAQRPLDPENPADPAYRFADVDAAVRAASARGLQILLEVGRAPSWAEGPNRPSLAEARAGTWRPDPQAYGQFARAVALRYSGDFSQAPTEPALPRVTRFQAGNEPNLAIYLTPQWSGGEPEAARIYRGLLSAFYSGIKSVDQANLVVSAGTAPYGDEPGERRTRPLTFIRELLCLNGRSLAAAGCDGPVPLDVLAHHPINAGPPFASADHPEDATTPDIGDVRELLRRAERKRRVIPRGSRPIWVTEFWWESDPPDETFGVSERTQARYITEALYLFWKQRVPLVLGLQLADSPIDPAAPGNTFQTGLYFADGREKEALTAFGFPLVADPGRRATKVWGRSPAAGKLRVERRRDRRWRTIQRLHVDDGEVFRVRIGGRGRPKVRASVGEERSLVYRPAAN